MNSSHLNLLQRFIKALHKIVEIDILLPTIESRIVQAHKSPDNHLQPIFIIGAPRTGSTILYEALISTYQVSYISNIAALFYRSPALCTWLTKNLARNRRFQGKSQFGYIRGLTSPSEAGRLFSYWFGEQSFNETPEIHNVSTNYIRSTVSTISSIMGGPLVTKNLNNSFRLRAIHKAFPNAIYLYIKRDPLYTAQSLLIARRKLFKNETHWFSVKPPGYESMINKSQYDQIAWQVKAVEDLIENEIHSLKLQRALTIHYQDFCADYTGTLKIISDHCNKYGLTLKTTKNTDKIVVRNGDLCILENREINLLKNSITKIYR